MTMSNDDYGSIHSGKTDLDLPASAQASLDMVEIRDALAKAEGE